MSRRALQIATALIAAAVCLHHTAPMQAAPRPLGVEELLRMRTFQRQTPIMLSVDGKQIAYTLSRSNEASPESAAAGGQTPGVSVGASNDVWLTDMLTGESRSVTGGQGSSWGTAWSPDGQSLALYSNRDGAARLWLWDREAQSLRRVSDAPIYPSFDAAELQWTPDGRQVLVMVLPQEAVLAVDASAGAPAADRQSNAVPDGRDEPTVRVLNSTGTSADPAVKPVSGPRPANDLALIEAASGQVRRIAKGVNPSTARISPNGKFVAFMDDSGEFSPDSFISLLDLKAVSLADGELRTLVKGIRMGGASFDRNDWSWSPDSRWLAYRDSFFRTEAYDAASWVSKAMLVSPDGEVRPVTTQAHPQFRGTPVWYDEGRFLYFFTAEEIWRIAVPGGNARKIAQLPGKTIKTLITASPNRDRLWTLDDGSAVVAVAETESPAGLEMGFYRIHLDSGRVTTLIEEQKRYVVDSYNVVDNLLASPLTGQIVYVAEDAQRPKDLWLLGGDLRHPRQLSRLNPDIDAGSMGKQSRIDWTGRDGTTHTGFLLLPRDYRSRQRYPLVAYVYPMTPIQFANYFGYMAGVGEHYYNMQLLASRGYAVLLAGAPLQPGEPMKSIADWALPGIDKVVQLGVADADRVGLFGASAGGYCVLSLLVQSTRFKAAVEHVGPGNLLSWYGAGLNGMGYSHGEFNAERDFGMAGHPWAAREQYIRNSPWFFLDKVTAPLLILHGTDDQAVSIAQSNEIFVGLRRLGKQAQYAVYDGEGHGFTSLANQIDATNRYLDWFDRHLKAAKE